LLALRCRLRALAARRRPCGTVATKLARHKASAAFTRLCRIIALPPGTRLSADGAATMACCSLSAGTSPAGQVSWIHPDG
jgi:hypothetical protein